jgi:hypothetical protein
MYVRMCTYVGYACMYACMYVGVGSRGVLMGAAPGSTHETTNAKRKTYIPTYIYIYVCVCVCPTHAHTLLLCPVYNPCISVCKQTQVQLLFNKSWFWGST